MSTELRVEKVLCCKNTRLTNHDKNRERRQKLIKTKNKEQKGRRLKTQIQHPSSSRMSLFLHSYPLSRTAEFLHPQTLCHNICHLIICCHMFSTMSPALS